MILPGATIGILGGGQLGRMLILAGRPLGYRFAVLDPDPESPAGSMADRHLRAPYDDPAALDELARVAAVATLEFENLPVGAVRALAARIPVRPGPDVLAICQHRRREKEFLRARGFPHAPFRTAEDAAGLEAALAAVGVPAVVKTASFGYDGKGQIKVESRKGFDAAACWAALGGPDGIVVEKWIEHRGELSVLVFRGLDGTRHTLPPVENRHRRHILHQSIVPARFPAAVLAEAETLAGAVAEALGVVGELAVECFVGPDGAVLVNELAPRPHNSGHFSIDAGATSQFEQVLRMACGLPAGGMSLRQPAVMMNLLGDLWAGGEPDWPRLLAEDGVKLHLYGKKVARPGRKMGHFTVLGEVGGPPPVERAEALFAALEAPGR